ncbi:hypothetical protein [Komagataeibacter sp. FNDCR2]|nr:hypothetical protein [Komagataeibacter sp. FNDCR2]MCE2576045.1 hypothetical protein [Komagataeibacter sp. FNDCR2]
MDNSIPASRAENEALRAEVAALKDELRKANKLIDELKTKVRRATKTGG